MIDIDETIQALADGQFTHLVIQICRPLISGTVMTEESRAAEDRFVESDTSAAPLPGSGMLPVAPDRPPRWYNCQIYDVLDSCLVNCMQYTAKTGQQVTSHFKPFLTGIGSCSELVRFLSPFVDPDTATRLVDSIIGLSALNGTVWPKSPINTSLAATMDEAYKQHHSRRKNRSSTSLNHLTLAPLTPKLPFSDDAEFSYVPPVRSTSYIQGKSAPTTPSILARPPTFPSTSRSRSRSSRRASITDAQLPKSKSACHLAVADHHHDASSSSTRRKAVSGATTPTRRARNDGNGIPRDDDDWLLRAGIVLSAEAREYKGQMWLTSRESSTSLVALRDDEADEAVLERELARDRDLMTRRSSVVDLVEGVVDGGRSTRGSRHGSRPASRVASRGRGMVSLEGQSLDEAYFDRDQALGDEYDQGPDFVNPEDRLEAMGQDPDKDDEATVRKLVKAEGAGRSLWFGLSLFSVEENPEDSDTSDDDDAEGEVDERRDAWTSTSSRHFEGVTNSPKELIPPPDPNQGGWHDAAWLLSVACKSRLSTATTPIDAFPIDILAGLYLRARDLRARDPDSGRADKPKFITRCWGTRVSVPVITPYGQNSGHTSKECGLGANRQRGISFWMLLDHRSTLHDILSSLQPKEKGPLNVYGWNPGLRLHVGSALCRQKYSVLALVRPKSSVRALTYLHRPPPFPPLPVKM
ncbi:hypothetical protein SODALDRAFT_375867 [Sodiomyces alkalinus F11]|uniref:Uncharacterized protein n=1 Tax=Sodiomyces alkalinus (strain CBS 110278 / VKM F-3762 / F11) TaxID=1314773 RepID=A0A3N2QAI2_SODAK|nr:hypothetical protein SODALDRAFT_375867 [Sodiomyces alkalinus F11]ROT43727.1 hypothetical protein SODALDRAFT_375867 [Sodiomyces alkalinus F11]